MPELTNVDIAVVTVMILLGSLVQGSLGFGAALIALPVLVFIDPVFAPGPLMALGFLMGFLILVRDRSGLDFGEVKIAWPGQIIGIVTAIYILRLIPKERMTFIFGIALLAAVLLTSSKLRVRITPGSLFLTGILSGLMGTSSALGGAPMGILYQNAPGKRLRSTVACLLMVGSGSVLVALFVTGQFGRAEWWATLILLPGSAAGFAFSWPLARYLDARFLRPVVLAFAGTGGVVLVARSLWMYY
jgi:hypothetical protein